MNNLFDISGKKAVVTGGSRGLGKAMAKGFLDAGCEVNSHDNDGRTALMRAAFQGEEAVVECLVEAGADLDATDSKGRTALMESVTAFKVGVIHYLLAKGADVNKRDNQGCTCLMRASYGGYTDLAI